MPPTHILVTAPEGRMTPIAPSDGTDPGRPVLLVDHGSVCRVRYSAEVRRSIARGDLLLCRLEQRARELALRPANDLEAAAAPKSLEEYFPDSDRELVAGDRVNFAELDAKRKARAEAKAKSELDEAAKNATPPIGAAANDTPGKE